MVRSFLGPIAASLLLAGCGEADAMREVVQGEINESASRGEVQGPVVDLTPAQLAERLERGDIRLIDVRTAKEVEKGMIPGAEHIALDAFAPAELDLSDGHEIVLYCRSGRRSSIAAERVAGHTGRPAAHLEGGILAWTDSDFAIEK
jgi:rhodanese-related sulfurtransferase